MTNTQNETPEPQTYTISYIQGTKYIECHHCGGRSHSPHDIENKRCPYCKIFHGDQAYRPKQPR